jgi:hypothetical protein
MQLSRIDVIANVIPSFKWPIVYNYLSSDVSMVEETEIPEEDHRFFTSHWQTLSHNVVSSTPRHQPIQITTLVEKKALIYLWMLWFVWNIKC